jgi:hypothetical protein
MKKQIANPLLVEVFFWWEGEKRECFTLLLHTACLYLGFTAVLCTVVPGLCKTPLKICNSSRDLLHVKMGNP